MTVLYVPSLRLFSPLLSFPFLRLYTRPATFSTNLLYLSCRRKVAKPDLVVVGLSAVSSKKTCLLNFSSEPSYTLLCERDMTIRRFCCCRPDDDTAADDGRIL